MAKKSAPKTEQDAHHINNFNAPIKVGRDFIAGDQINNIQPPATREEFIAQMQQVQIVLASIQQLPELTEQKRQEVEYIQEEMAKTLEEAQKPAPVAMRIKTTIENAKTVMDSLDAGIKSALNLGGTIATVGAMALSVAQLFGM